MSKKVYFLHRRVCIREAFSIPLGTSFASELVAFLEQGCTSQQKVDTKIKKWTRLLNSNVYLSV